VLGINQGDILTPAYIARLMTNEQGAMKNIPEQAAVYLLITHASFEKRDVVQELVSLVKRSPRLSGICCSVEPGEWFVI
jgi:hypothetical protein